MEIPPPNHPVWQQLATGALAGFQPRQLALQLLLTRLKHEPLSVGEKARMLHAFFTKYRPILTAEIGQLSHP